MANPDFGLLAGNMLGLVFDPGIQDHLERFKAHFGVSIFVVHVVWERLLVEDLLPTRHGGARPIHLLWALLFLKVYSTENVLSTMAQTTRKTFREWVWAMLEALSNMDVVSG